ncbi:MAG: hypothetical protein HYX72_07870 [Acidobacteria bacterium]|nr:hypothetical protein [Acidobacteriota bacterium]
MAASKALPAIIVLGVLAIYLALPTQNYYWDGIGFAQNIEDASEISPSLIHPNHLIYTVAGYVEYRLVHALGSDARALTILRIANSILSAAAAYVMFEILIGCFGSTYIAAVLAVVFAFSATWWRFSTDANAYIPAVLFLLLAFRTLLPGRPSRPIVAALWHSFAMLVHQLSILFYPLAVAGLWQQTAGLSLRCRVTLLIQYSAITFLVTGSAYLGAYSWIERTVEAGGSSHIGLLRWITSHSSDSSFTWDLGRNLLLSVRGHVRLFLGGRVSWSVRQWPYFSAVMIVILLALLAACIYRLMKLRKTKQSADSGTRTRPDGILILVAIWIVCYAVFLFFWLPGNTFYRLFYLPPLVLLGGALWRRQQSTRQPVYAAALLAGMMAVANFTFAIFPNSRLESNPPLEFARRLDHFWRAGTLVYYGSFNTDDWTIRYFHPETTWRKFELSTGGAPQAPQMTAAGEAWLDTTALDMLFSTADGLQWLAGHTPEKVRVELVNDRNRIVFQKVALRMR